MTLRLRLLVAFPAIFPCALLAAPINEIDYNSIAVGQTIDFEGIAGGPAPGTNYDGILNFGGVEIAERFAGQSVSASGNSDVLEGSPTGPLALETGSPGENIVVFSSPSEFSTQAMAGLGNLGFPQFNAIGEGAVAILYDNDQSSFGFQSVGGDLGSAIFEFFRRDGSLIDTLTPTNLGVDFFGFERDGGVNDIAGISIFNDDFAGIAFDNIIFDVPGDEYEPGIIPLPAGGFLLLTGIGIVGSLRRVRSS